MHVSSMANLIRKSQILKLFLNTKVEHDDISRECVEDSKESNPPCAFECVQIEKLPWIIYREQLQPLAPLLVKSHKLNRC
jgi:hypothetical protein